MLLFGTMSIPLAAGVVKLLPGCPTPLSWYHVAGAEDVVPLPGETVPATTVTIRASIVVPDSRMDASKVAMAFAFASTELCTTCCFAENKIINVEVVVPLNGAMLTVAFAESEESATTRSFSV